MTDEVRGWLTPKAVAAEAGVSQEFDLSQCVREPIHLLGGVQSYGALIAARLHGTVVDTVSRNTGEVLGVAAEELVGRPVTELIGDEQWALAREITEAAGPPEGPAEPGASEGAPSGPVASGVLSLSLERDGQARLFDVTVHRVAELLVLEFEPRAAEGPFVFQNFYPRVRSALHRLQGAADVTECCAAAVREVRALTGYDRVVAYRFDGAEGPGQVIAEARGEGREPWLGLWFPASDIPPQARRLYARNWIRVIGDVGDATVGLLPEVREGTGEPLDLSGSTLRTVSGYHLEYLRNIGVASSMSVSLLHEGELWGLIACHGDAPRRLTPEVRAACEFFGIALSLQLAAVAEREQADELSGCRRALATLLARLSSQAPDALLCPGSGLAELLHADGALLLRGTEVVATGGPVPAALPGLLERLAGPIPVGEVWSSDRVPEVLGLDPAEAEVQGVPAGLLFLPLNRDGDLLVWWRRERPAPREWAADPARPVRTGPGGERLTPRGSAAVYRATVRGRSAPWTPAQRAVAGELWREMSGLLSRHMAELEARNTELARTNEDLDSFAHAAAHDLKEPLRGISNAAAFMVEDAGDVLDATSLRRLTTVRRLAERMDGLLDSLLHFSRLGQVGLERELLELDEVVDDALLVAGDRLAEQGVTVVRPAPLPRLHADRERLREVLENLFVNAAKYAVDEAAAGERRVWVEAVPVAGPDGGRVTAVVVRDNGIGIPAEQHEDVLQLFRRLHRRDERGGGSGVGLAVVKRIVERHGGRLWLESPAPAPGGGPGTAVWFTLGG
ncbi:MULTISPECIES: ATP-binding protein [Streptomyces]|uniref:ATP-binding protein n=1 Tax=Streptomyces TaxID=1883 RepID=UPI00103F6A93|nr:MULTISPECIES: ATP-binding protein [Streptomyces]MBT3076503.1 GAF domain-containing protein [Streptomyces sp. COG21]MBT3078984.1 GAF domain-containing protein [Streptomyces sp. COG20]MBT3087854.1 GAF domain-containing protein [Streptomyces sp. CYG21]MBT3107150.1 GAF domain-containing protein [Streptomyces sp. COG19]MBT3109197.1 GAF domain-containing protein [Streptomyces sp. CYG20]